VIGKLVDNRTNQEHEIAQSPTPVGRHDSNLVRLRGFAISRFHAEIGESAPGKPYIEDMGSTYGTYVNGQKVEGRTELHDGDAVVLGVSTGFPDGEFSFTFHQARAVPGEARKTARPASGARIKVGSVSRVDNDQAHVFRLEGVFRRNECDALAEASRQAVRAEPRDVVIELSGVEYMNSYALGVLVRVSHDVDAESKRMVLAGAQGIVLKLFTTVGLDRRISVYPSLQDALAALKAR
jgi:anti-sigma B factor antagonist